MSDRFKYSRNGVFRYGNFARLARQNIFPRPRVPIGSVGGIDGWHRVLRVKVENGKTFVHPFIWCDEKPAVAFHVFYNVVKANGLASTSFDWFYRVLDPKHGVPGYDLDVAELLDEENGYLDGHGALEIECGIHVDAILGDDRIWKFNLKDNFFGYEKNEKSIIVCTEMQTKEEHILHIHPQLFTFKSSPSVEFYQIKFAVETCLQIAHGVRFHFEYLSPSVDWHYTFLEVIRVARSLKLQNVVAYCEQEFMKQDFRKPMDWQFYQLSIKLNLRRVLACFLKRIRKMRTLIEGIDKWGLDQMTGETMKMLAGKIFELGAENF